MMITARQISPKQQQKPQDRRHRDEDRDLRRAAAAEGAEDRRQEMVAPHRQRVPAGRENAGVGDGGEGQQRRERDKGNAPGVGENPRGLGHGRGRVETRQSRRAQDAHHHSDPQHIHQDRRGEGQEDAQGQVALRILHLLGDAGDVGHADVADEDQAGGGDDRFPAFAEEVLEVDAFDLSRAVPDEPGEDGQETEDEEYLEAAGLAGPQHVYDPEQQRQRRRDRAEIESVQHPREGGVFLGEQAEQQGQVGAHAHQGERGLQDEGQPGAEAAHGSGQGPQAAVEEVVRAAGPGHGRGQLHDAEHRRHQQRRRDDVGENDRGPRALGRVGR
jgi:hypothetical protein